MKKIIIGILAHVDAGKTTLSESMLYLSGKLRRLGRVDNKDAFLDTNEIEKARGITIFSKQAIFNINDTEITLLDTPGHVDFSAEMERTLQVLDYAILVISGSDGIQGHTKTLWRLLEIYNIPTFIFVNKMDQPGAEQISLGKALKAELGDGCIEFANLESEDFFEQIALCDEALMEAYLHSGVVSEDQVRMLIQKRLVFPVLYGSALKLDGVMAFMDTLDQFTIMPSYMEQFAAKIYKITRDELGNRLTHMKITGGSLKVKDALKNKDWEEKVNQIRVYSGVKYEVMSTIEAGSICAVTGLNYTKAGQGLGVEDSSNTPILEPVLSYKVILAEGIDERVIMPKLRILEEEEPELHFVWDEQLKEISVQIMGEVQLEILQTLVQNRFDFSIEFGEGSIVYKEKVTGVSEGVGHFEPLRHYAEVHLLLEPGQPGSGIVLESVCSEEVLDKSYQRLVLSHLGEKDHRGVLTGSPITDMKITLVSGRAHNKHTEGGDFREATFRAVRQGLMEAESLLLEPYYSFRLELPEHLVGKAMTDIENMFGQSEISQSKDGYALLTGLAPVATMRNYQRDVVAYTKGHGRLFLTLSGYDVCHNADEVIDRIAYDYERDFENPTGSVFCSHGSGYYVPWDQVKKHMHVEAYLKVKKSQTEQMVVTSAPLSEEKWLSLEEIDQIINSTFNANSSRKGSWKKSKRSMDQTYETVSANRIRLPKQTSDVYLLVDAYNIIFAWPDLYELAKDNMDSARMKLLDILSNYQGLKKCKVIVVFDAYRVEGRRESIEKYHNIDVVFTGEAQTADHYIEKFAHQNQNKYHITVATSDGLQQMIIRGAGCALLSARELMDEVRQLNIKLNQEYLEVMKHNKTAFEDVLSIEDKQLIQSKIKE